MPDDRPLRDADVEVRGRPRRLQQPDPPGDGELEAEVAGVAERAARRARAQPRRRAWSSPPERCGYERPAEPRRATAKRRCTATQCAPSPAGRGTPPASTAARSAPRCAASARLRRRAHGASTRPRADTSQRPAPRRSTATGRSGTTVTRSVCGNARSRRRSRPREGVDATLERDRRRARRGCAPSSGASARRTCSWTRRRRADDRDAPDREDGCLARGDRGAARKPRPGRCRRGASAARAGAGREPRPLGGTTGLGRAGARRLLRGQRLLARRFGATRLRSPRRRPLLPRPRTAESSRAPTRLHIPPRGTRTPCYERIAGTVTADVAASVTDG